MGAALDPRQSAAKFPVRHRDTRAVRALFGVFALVLDLVPLLVFAALAYGAVSMALDPLTPASVTLSVLVYATVEARLILCVARALLLPADAGTLILPIDAETRNYLYIWVKRFVFCGIFGFAVPQAAWWLGIPGALYTLLLKLAGLVVALLALIFLLQNRTDRRMDRRRRNIGVGLGPRPPQPGRYLAAARRLLHCRDLFGLRAAHRGRLRLCAAGHRAERRRHRRVAGSGSLDAQPEPARLRDFAAAQGAVSDIGAARQPLCPDPDRAGSAVIYILAGLTLLQAWDIRAFAWLDTDRARWFGGELLTIGLVSWPRSPSGKSSLRRPNDI